MLYFPLGLDKFLYLAEFHETLFFNKGKFSGSADECGFTYEIHVFKDFVMVRTLPIPGNKNSCFGAWTNLDGFYLKKRP